MTKNDVRAYYAIFAEREWQRLTNTNDGAIEYALTCAMLERHLPPAGRILDIGGGAGRYTIWLAERGYQIVLADLSPNLLELAQARIAEAGVTEQVEAIVEADVCDLSGWSDESFDAVVCLGPFYHLPDPEDREHAASELTRVLRPGGHGIYRINAALGSAQARFGETGRMEISCRCHMDSSADETWHLQE